MILFLIIGLGVGTALGESTSEADSDDTPSTINARWLKSKSAARDISYSSSFGSEDFDSPDIPSNFHARWGINKTWGARTPHPILSRRVSFEDYGKVPPSPDSFDDESPEEQQSTSSEHEIKDNTNSRTTLSPNPLTSNKNLNEKTHQTTLKKTIKSQTKAPSSSGKQKPTSKVKAVGSTRSRKTKEKVPKATQVLTQLPTAMIKTEIPSSDGTPKETDVWTTESPKYLSSTTAPTTRPTSPPPDVDRTNTHSTAHSTLGTTPSFLKQATTAGQEFSTLPPLSTSATSQFKTRSWDAFPKMVPILCFSFLVGGSAYVVYHVSHAAAGSAHAT